MNYKQNIEKIFDEVRKLMGSYAINGVDLSMCTNANFPQDGWKDWKQQLIDQKEEYQYQWGLSFAKLNQEDIEPYPQYSQTWDELDFVDATTSLTLPCTVLYGIWYTGIFQQLTLQQQDKNNKFLNKQLCIYIVGANVVEFNNVQIMELIQAYIPQLQLQKVYLIGPDLPDEGDSYFRYALEWDSFYKVSQELRYLDVYSYVGFYHELEKDGWSKPDLVFCFNSGIHDSSGTWIPTLKSLIEMNVPVFTTAYNEEEIHDDVGIIKNICNGHMILQPQINPFQSLCPLPEKEVMYKCYYMNYYVCGFQGEQQE
eukprot:TRINITY_DN17352_c0_g1_i2.p1 TRINITY_DN17352_c0_g1~~TRINITY_DN17352_c0_g1_i2.p1  ORF type:complete len:312 (-),score=32.33 TRINITY_DN17352_c0_g1_i2:375-1310(-)